MNSHLAILCCSPAFLPAESHGGLPYSTYYLCKALIRAGADVRVVTTDRNGAARLNVAKDCWTSYGGVPVWYARTARGPFLYAASAPAAIAATMPQVDCVINSGTLWVHSGWLAWRYARRYRKPSLTYLRGLLDPWAFQFKGFRKQAHWRLIGRRILEDSAAIVALSEAEYQTLRALNLRTRIEVIPNGATLAVPDGDAALNRAALDARYPAIAGHRYVLFLGRIHEKKGIDVLLEAIARSRGKHPDVAFVIAGPVDPSYAARWTELVAAHRLEDALVLPGAVRGGLKAAWLTHAELFVLPSYSEGLPIAVLEALVSGVPAVVSQGCHLPEVQESGAGIVIEPNAPALVAAIDAILTNGSRRGAMAKCARRLAETTFSWDKIALRTLALCCEVIEAGRVR